MVKDFYSQMGFGRLNGKWEMNLSDFRPMKTLVYQERNE
jgi:hypothetical protein